MALDESQKSLCLYTPNARVEISGHFLLPCRIYADGDRTKQPTTMQLLSLLDAEDRLKLRV